MNSLCSDGELSAINLISLLLINRLCYMLFRMDIRIILNASETYLKLHQNTLIRITLNICMPVVLVLGICLTIRTKLWPHFSYTTSNADKCA